MERQMDMRGSGIYGYDTQINLICKVDTCDFDDEIDANVNDYGTISGNCPKCGKEYSDLTE
jgi:hypothetical protein